MVKEVQRRGLGEIIWDGVHIDVRWSVRRNAHGSLPWMVTPAAGAGQDIVAELLYNASPIV